MSLTIDSTLDERATIAVSFETISALVDFYAKKPPSFSPIELAWDIRGQLGDDGYEVFRELMLVHEMPARVEYIDEVWADCDRATPTQFDRLLFDEIGWARRKGFRPPRDIEPIFAKLESEMRTLTAVESPVMSNVLPLPLPIGSPVPAQDLIKTSAEFVKGFVPPDYLVDGILQRRFCYSLTAQTGVGKTAVAMLLAGHVSLGRVIGTHEVAKGSVLYFAGENPTDIQMRWLGLTRELGIDPATADVHFVAGAMPLSQIAERITSEVVRKGLTLSLVVVDTAAAYFEGDDENSNTQAVDHAKRMRSLTLLSGGPCVVILCHPTKRAADDDLIPRGGGAFLAEVDGNVALRKRESMIAATAQGKFRGSDSWSLSFEIKPVQHPMLKDSKGREIWTVVAKPLTDAGKRQLEAASRRQEDGLLRALDKHPGASLRELAEILRWLDKAGKPVPERVRRAAEVLARENLILKHRGAWQLTPKGQKELNELDRATAVKNYPLTGVTPLVTPPVQLPPPTPPK